MYYANRLDTLPDYEPGTAITCPCCNWRGPAAAFAFDGYGWSCRDTAACDARARANAINVVDDPDMTQPLELPF